MEHIISFLPAQFPRAGHFYVEMTGITYPDKAYHIQRACSDIYCLEYVIEGEGYVNCGGTEFYPRKGDVYLLPPGLRHDYHAMPENPFHKIWMNISGSLCDNLYHSYNLEKQYYFPDCPLYQLFWRFQNIFDESRANSHEAAIHGELVFHEIMAALFSWAEGARPREKTAAGLAKEFMDLHIEQKLSIRELCREVGVSPAQLNRVFQKEYGETPYRYFLTQKLATACSMLRNTGLQVREISDKLGFCDEHYFSVVFRENIGLPPRGYRQKAQQP